MQGTYEFWANVRISAQEILQPHRDATVERIAEHPIVLAIQDTTELDFGNTQRIRKLGSLSHGDAKGLKVHTVLCSTAFMSAIRSAACLRHGRGKNPGRERDTNAGNKRSRIKKAIDGLKV